MENAKSKKKACSSHARMICLPWHAICKVNASPYYSRTLTHWDGKNRLPIAFRSAVGKEDVMFVCACGCVCVHIRLCVPINSVQISTDCLTCFVPRHVRSSSVIMTPVLSAAPSWEQGAFFCLETRDLTSIRKHSTASANRMHKATLYRVVSQFTAQGLNYIN